ncbi:MULTISPECIES: MOSC domain-containing protein [Mycobacteriaceae]|uniref:MOSC domain-containing protein n=1 Tax=Mycobacteriaceae TaxID=1762 RepID=UPI0002EDEA47|nr:MULTISPECIES: MOSC N-terminal beta barrel domain-containing protein [Mycobacteriaceae]AXK77818.1 MOSC domain-containing protein [Mycolicibacterium neoaurum]
MTVQPAAPKVAELWRFPVKSMGGCQVDRVAVDARGVHADRLWAVRDVDKGVTASARRIPALLGCTARYLAEPDEQAGPGRVPAVAVTFPDGRELTSDDPGIHAALSELAGRRVRLTALPPVGDTSAHRMKMVDSLDNYRPEQVRKDFGLADGEPLPDTSVFPAKDIITLARYSTPPGTFVDLAPLHLMSTASLRNLTVGAEVLDVRRFRPNVLIDLAGKERSFPESDWVGGELSIGSARLKVTMPTIRCVVPTRPQPGIELDRTITRALAERTDRFLGVYIDVRTPGVLSVGDEVRVRAAEPPTAVQRATMSVTRSATRAGQWLLEQTVMRVR